MKNILWLCSWFPNEEEPIAGDFLERHAIAAAIINNVHVIFVKRSLSANKAGVIRKTYNPNLSADIVSYYIPGGKFTSIISFIRFVHLQRQLINAYVKRQGKPDLVHVHINLKAGIGALYAKRRFGIPFVVSEQWTGFCSNAKPGFYDQPFWMKGIIRSVLKNASGISAVSRLLGAELENKFNTGDIVRIPNVVDPRIFFPAHEKGGPFQFIHISTLKYQKNFEDILRACAMLRSQTERTFAIEVYGPHVSELKNMTRQLGLDQLVRFNGEVGHSVIAEKLRECHALILYSRFETFGCVVIEAYASGLPVIVSDIPVMREIVLPHETGILVKPEDPAALANAMLMMMERYHQFESAKIARYAADNFSYSQVGNDFDQLYEGVLKKSD